MGLFKTLLGKKTYCSVCGAPLPPNRLQGADGGEPVCSDRCREAMESLLHSPRTSSAPSHKGLSTPVDIFGLPEVTVYVFRSNDPAAFYSLQEQIIETQGESGLRVSRLDSPDVSLVAVAGPIGSMVGHRKMVRLHLGPMAKEAKLRPEKIRPDATYSNVSTFGLIRAGEPAIAAVCDKIRRGVFRLVFSGPPSAPPSSSAPVLRAMTDDILMDHACALIDRHISFFPGGVLKVEADGVSEAGLLFAELARRKPDDPEPAYFEASAFVLALRHDVASMRLEELRRRFPDHLESCLLASSGKSIFAYPSYEMCKPIPNSIRERTQDVAVALTRSGRRVQPVMFVETRGREAPQDSSPVAYPIFFETKGVPIIGVAVVFSDEQEQRFEAILAGFEEYNGQACTAPRACYLFRASGLPVVLHDGATPVACVQAAFDSSSLDAFRTCEDTFRSMPPRSFGVEDLSQAVEAYNQIHPLDRLPSL